MEFTLTAPTPGDRPVAGRTTIAIAVIGRDGLVRLPVVEVAQEDWVLAPHVSRVGGDSSKGYCLYLPLGDGQNLDAEVPCPLDLADEVAEAAEYAAEFGEWVPCPDDPHAEEILDALAGHP